MSPVCSYCNSDSHYRGECPHDPDLRKPPKRLDDVKPRTVMLNAASLMSESGENPEYDRALVELVSDLLGVSDFTEPRDAVETLLRGLK